MFFLSKKRIILLVSLLIAVVAIGIFQINLKEETIETVALPVSNKVIVLDAGHGNPDGGAVSTNGISEAEINLKIALKLQNLLEQSGATVILTRSDENGIYDADKTKLKNQKVSDIKNRVKIGNSSSADIFVSIHLNKIPQSQYSGWQTFFKSGSEQGEKLATLIQENLNKTIEKENNRVPMKLDNVYIVKNVEIPLTIVECGFLSNEEEERKLQEDDYQDKLEIGRASCRERV